MIIIVRTSGSDLRDNVDTVLGRLCGEMETRRVSEGNADFVWKWKPDA